MDSRMCSAILKFLLVKSVTGRSRNLVDNDDDKDDDDGSVVAAEVFAYPPVPVPGGVFVVVVAVN